MSIPRWADGSPARVAVVVACVNAVMLALLASAQWIGWGAITGLVDAGGTPARSVATGVYVLAVNLAGGVGMVVLVFGLGRPAVRSWPVRVAVTSALALVTAGLRLLALQPVGDPVSAAADLVDAGTTAVGYVATIATALLVGDLARMHREGVERQVEVESRAARNVARLESEEAIRRRVLADRLHGTVQNRLVLVTAGIDHLADRLDQGVCPDAARQLRELGDTIDEIRDQDVRSLSYDLFPLALDVSIKRAVGVLLDRLPRTLTGHLVLGSSYRSLVAARDGVEPVAMADRLAVLDTVEEALTNAVKHGEARTVTVDLDLRQDARGTPTHVLVTVTNDGTPLSRPDPELCGLARHRARIEAKGGRLDLAPGGPGTVLSLELPFRTDDGDPAGGPG